METNQKVKIYNTTLTLKGVEGTFIKASQEGFYELYMKFEGKKHQVLLPITNTVIISEDAVVESEEFSQDIIR